MTGPTHLLLGASAAVVYTRLSGSWPDALSFCALLLGSLAPDIDGRGKWQSFRLKSSVWIYRWLLWIPRFLLLLLGWSLNFVFGHRGFIHSPAMVILFVALGASLEFPCLYWFAGGYALHLLADFVTPSGIPLWSPFSPKSSSLKLLKTGSPAELVFSLVLLLATCALGFPLFPR